MKGEVPVWAVVLAGSRMGKSALSLLDQGESARSERAARELNLEGLSRVVSRAQKVADKERCFVVAPAEFVGSALDDNVPVDDDRLLRSPCDRGTACSLLWPLVRIAFENPEATVVVLSAHREDVGTVAFARALEAAIQISRHDTGKVILLARSSPGPGGGSGRAASSNASVTRLEMVATDDRAGIDRARQTLGERCLRDDLAMAARADSLLGLFEWSIPWLVRMFNYWLVDPKPELQSRMAEHLFRILPEVDLADRVLAGAPGDACVVGVPSCQCSDLGLAEKTPRCRFRSDGCGLAATSVGAPAVPVFPISSSSL